MFDLVNMFQLRGKSQWSVSISYVKSLEWLSLRKKKCMFHFMYKCNKLMDTASFLDQFGVGFKKL